MKKTNTDAPFFLLMGKIGDLVFANVLWLVCCIPVVTAGASFLLLLVVGCCGSWAFALLARFSYPKALSALADGGRMTLANLLPSVGILAFLAWLPLLAKAAPAWFVYLLPLWLLIGGAGSALGMASLMRPAFAQLEKAGRKEEEPEEETDTEDSTQ